VRPPAAHAMQERCGGIACATAVCWDGVFHSTPGLSPGSASPCLVPPYPQEASERGAHGLQHEHMCLLRVFMVFPHRYSRTPQESSRMSECASDLRPLQWAELCAQRALGERSALKRTVQTWPFIRNRRTFDQACSIRWNRAWLAMSTEPPGCTLSVAFASASVGAVACASPARSFPVNVARKRSMSARVVASKTGELAFPSAALLKCRLACRQRSLREGDSASEGGRPKLAGARLWLGRSG
jgi:hypothetical protein